MMIAYLHAAIYYNLIRISHPLLITSKNDTVENLIQALSVVRSIELSAANYGVLFHAVSRRLRRVISAAVTSTEGCLKVCGS